MSTPKPIALAELVELFRRVGDAEFAARWSSPVLVRKADREEARTPASRTFHTRGNQDVAMSEIALRRARAAREATSSRSEDIDSSSWDPDLRVDDVLPLRKRAGSTTFGERIGIGRTQNMDVFVDLPRVSKYHAYVTIEGDELQLCDARSSFGTFVEGERLEPLVPVAVPDGARVELGPYAFRIHTASGLRAYVATLALARA